MAAEDGSAAPPEKEESSATPQEDAHPSVGDEVGPDLGTVPTPPEPPEPQVLAEPQENGAEAALAESDNHKVTYKVGETELELQLPPKLAASVVFRAGVLRDDDGEGASRLIQSVLGDELFNQVMDKMDENGLTIDDEEAMTSIGNLVNDALAVYGVSSGKSEASPKS